jgi:hypothetical protein
LREEKVSDYFFYPYYFPHRDLPTAATATVYGTTSGTTTATRLDGKSNGAARREGNFSVAARDRGAGAGAVKDLRVIADNPPPALATATIYDRSAAAGLMYHSHLVGRYLGLVSLDSNCLTPVEAQVPYLRERVGALNASGRFPIVLYHNPATTSSVSRTETNIIGAEEPRLLVKHLWMPIIANGGVPLTFEFHAHLFKRTKELDANGDPIQVDAAAASNPSPPAGNSSSGLPPPQQRQRGVVYVGDGAMGVWSSARQPLPNGFGHIAVAAGSNAVHCVLCIPSNRSCRVQSVRPAQGAGGTGVHTLIDEVWVAPRN